MLSINVKMAGISFLLLPLVAILTFVFRHLSRKAYQITRNKITEAEHLPVRTYFRYEADPDLCTWKREIQWIWRQIYGTVPCQFPRDHDFCDLPAFNLSGFDHCHDLVIRTGSLSVLNGSLSLGTLFVFITYISSFFEPIQELSEQLGTLQSSMLPQKRFSVFLM